MTLWWGCLAYYITVNINKRWHLGLGLGVPEAAACGQRRAGMEERQGALCLLGLCREGRHLGTHSASQK